MSNKLVDIPLGLIYNCRDTFGAIHQARGKSIPHFDIRAPRSALFPGTMLINMRSPALMLGSECTAPLSWPMRKNEHSPGAACAVPNRENSFPSFSLTASAVVAQPTHRIEVQEWSVASACLVDRWISRAVA